MSASEIEQLEMLAEVDGLTAKLKQWAEAETYWAPVSHCQDVIRRLLDRIQSLRIRLETPLVVATFGGTGTGKSSLVNALVGRECSSTGRQRPTTLHPMLIVHPEIAVDTLGLSVDEMEVVRCDAPILREIVLLDCPDPDTCEEEARHGNLERLRHLLPHCDVLLYTTTQQKYRSARVGEELGQAATGCRLLFVQTHADLDEDVRSDWRKQLEKHYHVPETFFVDSLRALQEQARGERPTGDFGRLQDLLTTRLSASYRVRIRRANLLELIFAAVERCQQRLTENRTSIDRLDNVLREQRDKLLATMTARLRDELLLSRHLWERRLLGAVTEIWGFSPFSSILRFYNGMGSWLTSLTLFRARSSAQMALVGAFQGARWLSARRREREAESQLQRIPSLGLADSVLRESQLLVSGYVREAQMEPALAESVTLDTLRDHAAHVEEDFLGDASARIDSLIAGLAQRSAGRLTRFAYEFCFMIYVVFVLYRIGENFFYGSFLKSVLGKTPDPMLSADFYIPAVVFFVLWSGMLVMLFTRRLRRGLTSQVESLAGELANSKLAGGIFPEIETACRNTYLHCDKLEALLAQITGLRQRLAALPDFGVRIDSEKERPG